ncbi:MAG: hypothetical protein KA179_00035 [Sulfuritalea sp.]|nr:hypothetical protein [Sulfuritalea sp.]
MEAYPDVVAAAHDMEERLADYLAEYEFDGDQGCRAPTTEEMLLIEHAIRGLLADDAFLFAIVKWRNLVAGYRRGSGGA